MDEQGRDRPARVAVDVDVEPLGGASIEATLLPPGGSGLSTSGGMDLGGLPSRLARGLGALSIGALLNLGGQILIVAFALRIWGGARYGEWVVLSGLVVILKLSDLGLQTYVGNRICMAYVNGDRDGARDMLRSTLGITAALSALLLVLAVSLASALPLREALGITSIGRTAFILCVALLSAELLLNVSFGLLAALYRGTGHLARAGMVGNATQAAILAATCGLIVADRGFLAVAAARFAIAVLSMGWVARDARRLYPWVGAATTPGSWRIGARMIAPGSIFLLIPMSDFMMNQVLVLIVQRFEGAVDVSTFVTHRAAANLPLVAGAIMIAVVWPELTALHARGLTVQVRRLLGAFSRYYAALMALGAVMLVPFIMWIYPLWTGNRLHVSALLLGLMAARIAMWGAWSPASNFLMAINQHVFVSVVLVADAVLTAVLAVPMTLRWGLAGAAFANVLADALLPLWLLPWRAARELGSNVSSVVRPALEAVGIAAIPAASVIIGLTADLDRAFNLASLAIAVGVALAVLWMRSRADRKFLREMLGALVRRRSAGESRAA